ncbi:MAG: hypothetical protein P8R04_03565 [Gammaproteobacteria bacterium]|nr:hypothetical protein [Gammaproteobacteria bacterium]
MLNEGWLSLLLRGLAALCLLLHFLQLAWYPEIMNLRTTIAVCACVLMVFFARSLSANRYAIPVLEVAGVAGACLIMGVLHSGAS